MKNFLSALLITVLSSMLMCNIAISASEGAAQYPELDDWIEALAEDGELSGAFLYAKNGRILFEKTVGTLHPHTGGTILSTSSFNLASVSKHFTAVAVMILQYEGELEYDTPVSEYLPEFPYDEITVRHLLQHTSGLTDYMALVDDFWNGDLLTNQALVDLYQVHKPALEFAPGSRFSYSNTGYVFLAALVERISGETLEEFMESNVFSPLSLNDSGVFNLLSAPDSFQSRVYGQHDGELNDLNFLDGVSGDGAVYSSVRDLLAWHKSLSDGSLLPLSALEEAFEPAELTDGSLSYYGFGWQLSEDDPNLMEHDGSWVGFNTYMIRNTGTDSLLVLLTNDSTGIEIGELKDRFFDAIEPDSGF